MVDSVPVERVQGVVNGVCEEPGVRFGREWLTDEDVLVKEWMLRRGVFESWVM